MSENDHKPLRVTVNSNYAIDLAIKLVKQGSHEAGKDILEDILNQVYEQGLFEGKTSTLNKVLGNDL